jgi:hypothetical protein
VGSGRPQVRRAAHVVESDGADSLASCGSAPGDPGCCAARSGSRPPAGRGDGALARAAPVEGSSHDRLTGARSQETARALGRSFETSSACAELRRRRRCSKLAAGPGANAVLVVGTSRRSARRRRG